MGRTALMLSQPTHTHHHAGNCSPAQTVLQSWDVQAASSRASPRLGACIPKQLLFDFNLILSPLPNSTQNSAGICS